MKIAVVGAGYVGLTVGVLLSQNNEVVILDIESQKVKLINSKKSPIDDFLIQDYLENKSLSIRATLDARDAYQGAELVVIATPTDYDAVSNYFNTNSIEKAIENVIEINAAATIIIKSTIPIGYTNKIREIFKTDKIIFSPEFLREGCALYDNLHPSRIVVGERSDRAQMFANLLLQGAIAKDVKVLLTDSTEAEAIKLFANSYLAMRVAYINELDTYALENKLDSRMIIDGISSDPRIGAIYNNPSFGYGGYCLPKDTQQLLANYENIPQSLIEAIVSSNSVRKKYIAEKILELSPRTIGMYRLIMKTGSDNFRSSAIHDVISNIKNKEPNINIILYEPSCMEDYYMGCKVIKSIEEFKTKSDLIVSNRRAEELDDVALKLFTRDIYGEN
jgi:UDPglucose 6-dehydrogenase